MFDRNKLWKIRMCEQGDRLQISSMNYSTWRTLAAAELKRLHGIDDNRIPDRIWKQFYVQNSTAREAANRAQQHHTNIGPALERGWRGLKEEGPAVGELKGSI